MKKIIIILSCFFIFTISCGISSKNEKMDIELFIHLDEPLYEYTFIDLKYEWLINENSIELDENTAVYVHFYNLDQNRLIIQDDHKLPAPLEYGENIKYTRRVFIPFFIHNLDRNYRGRERIRVNAGLYNPDTGFSSNLFRKTFYFSTLPYQYPEINYKKGWHGQEIASGFKPYRWTGQEAILSIENIGLDKNILIRGSSPKEILPDQTISISVKDYILKEFMPEQDDFEIEFKLSQDLIHNKDDFELKISTDKTFIPSQKGLSESDSRELGIIISLIYIHALDS